MLYAYYILPTNDFPNKLINTMISENVCFIVPTINMKSHYYSKIADRVFYPVYKYLEHTAIPSFSTDNIREELIESCNKKLENVKRRIFTINELDRLRGVRYDHILFYNDSSVIDKFDYILELAYSMRSDIRLTSFKLGKMSFNDYNPIIKHDYNRVGNTVTSYSINKFKL